MKILCLGDLSLDTYSPNNQSFFGGCSVNVARQLYEKLKYKNVGLYTALGTDLASRDAKQYLEGIGLEVRVKIIDGDCPRQPIEVDKNGERHLYDYHDGVLPSFSCSDLGGFFLNQWQLICFPYYKQVESMVQSLIKLNPKARLACDFGNLSDYNGDLEHVRTVLPKLSYAQFSSEQNRSDNIDATRKTYFANETLDRDLIIVDTHGPNGASAYKQGKSYYCCAPKVLQVTDTTGAGDAFLAHFIHSYYVENRLIEDALFCACVGGSKQVTHLGPGPL
jgi:sugar/nucleoside kinase (ribokinase family)